MEPYLVTQVWFGDAVNIDLEKQAAIQTMQHQ
jgi:hypothetical protein